MSDEAGRYTAEHTVMDKDVEIRELKYLLEVKDKRIKELENINEEHRKLNGELRQEVEKLRGLSSELSKEISFPLDDVDYAITDESEDNFTEQLSFKFNQE